MRLYTCTYMCTSTHLYAYACTCTCMPSSQAALKRRLLEKLSPRSDDLAQRDY